MIKTHIRHKQLLIKAKQPENDKCSVAALRMEGKIAEAPIKLHHNHCLFMTNDSKCDEREWLMTGTRDKNELFSR